MLFVIIVVFLFKCTGGLVWKPINRIFTSFTDRAKLSSDAVTLPTFNAPLLQSIRLQNWGAFANASIIFPQRPALTVITGETGSGKSMLLQSIAYGAGLTNNKLTRDGLLENMQVNLEFTCHDSEPFIVAKRIYQTSKKRSECELSNYAKAKVKDLESNLSPLIRFWSADSIANLDNDKFMAYIDQGLTNQSVLMSTQEAYHLWCQEHRELTDLQDLQRHAEKSNLLEELDSTLIEFQDLEKSVEHIVEQLDEFFAVDGVISTSTSISQKSNTGENTLDDKVLERMLKQDILKWQDFQDLIKVYFDQEQRSPVGKSDKNQHNKRKMRLSQVQWDIAFVLMQQAKTFVKFYQQVIQSHVYKHTEPVGKLMKPANSPVTVSEVITVVEQLEADVAQLQKKLQSIDLLRLVSPSPFKDLNHGILMMKSSLEQMETAYEVLVDTLPSKPNLLTTIQSVEKQWMSLATKHVVSPNQICLAYSRVQDKFNKVINFNDEFPLYQQREKELRQRYVKHARVLSHERFRHTSKLLHSINDILPLLDMQDKCIYVDFQSAVHSELTNGESASSLDIPTHSEGMIDSSLFSASGWDQVVLTLSKPAHSMPGQFVHNLPLVLRNKHVAEYDDDPSSDFEENEPPADSDSNELLGKANNVFKVLSSGEQARLALALELSLSSNNSILVLDEIDNHVGGEAVVKLADLLHQHAQTRQIIAVTHNVNVALKADKHIFVSKVQSQKLLSTSTGGVASSISSSPSNKAGRKNAMPSSAVYELSSEEERNDEVMRILGGASNIKSLLDLLESNNRR